MTRGEKRATVIEVAPHSEAVLPRPAAGPAALLSDQIERTQFESQTLDTTIVRMDWEDLTAIVLVALVLLVWWLSQQRDDDWGRLPGPPPGSLLGHLPAVSYPARTAPHPPAHPAASHRPLPPRAPALRSCPPPRRTASSRTPPTATAPAACGASGSCTSRASSLPILTWWPPSPPGPATSQRPPRWGGGEGEGEGAVHCTQAPKPAA